MKPEDEWGSPGGQEMFQELFIPLMERNRTASQRRFQTDDLIWMSPSLIDVCFLLLNYFLVTTTIVKKTEYLYATSFDLSAKCRLSAFCDRLG
jgi:hypothetical protein